MLCGLPTLTSVFVTDPAPAGIENARRPRRVRMNRVLANLRGFGTDAIMTPYLSPNRHESRRQPVGRDHSERSAFHPQEVMSNEWVVRVLGYPPTARNLTRTSIA